MAYVQTWLGMGSKRGKSGGNIMLSRGKRVKSEMTPSPLLIFEIDSDMGYIDDF